MMTDVEFEELMTWRHRHGMQTFTRREWSALQIRAARSGRSRRRRAPAEASAPVKEQPVQAGQAPPSAAKGNGYGRVFEALKAGGQIRTRTKTHAALAVELKGRPEFSHFSVATLETYIRRSRNGS